MDDRLRREERSSDAEKGDAAALAEFLRARQRRGEKAADLAGKLAEYAQDTRKGAYSLLVMNEDEQVRQEALVHFGQQIAQARELAIQPREGDAPLPEREAILRSIQRTLTPEQARIFLNNQEVHEPKLVLVPVTSPARYEEELTTASRSIPNSVGPYISPFAEGQLASQAQQAGVEGNRIKQWCFAITEGTMVFAVPEWDNERQSTTERISRFEERYKHHHITPLDYKSYVALMIQGLNVGHPMDAVYFGKFDSYRTQTTLLKERGEEVFEGEEDEGEDMVPIIAAGEWDVYHQRVNLFELNIAARDGRFRMMVSGEIQ